MDQKKIGSFMKELRKQKGLTQEQLAGHFNVSDRTVSRWENGNNMPDLSILVELADYYDIDIRELIGGERKSENMESELKDTLQKVADYSDMQKQKVAEAGNIAFGIAFIMGAITIVVQLLVKNTLSIVFGETVILVVGGVVYLLMAVRNGVFESRIKATKKNYTMVTMICSGVFSVVLFLFLNQKADSGRVILYTIIFFVMTMIAGRMVLFLLSKASKKNNKSEGNKEV